MSCLRVTLIDVGWGDSLLLESEDDQGNAYYGLIDSNDTSTLRSSHIFLKRFFEKKKMSVPAAGYIFEWVLLTHAHADHGQGLKKILRDFGAARFWYSQTANQPAFFADLLRYSARSPRVGQYDVVDTSKILPLFGAASMQALWPLPGNILPNENNNSVVMLFTLGNVSFVTTGDAEADGVGTQIAGQIPPNTRFFKVPHHGSDNGTFTNQRTTPWLNSLAPNTTFAISSHVEPFNHPDQTVIQALSVYKPTYRTDQHYHVTVETDGTNVTVTYSHV